MFPTTYLALPSYDGQIVKEDIMDSDGMEEHDRFLQVIGKRYVLTGSGEGRLGNLDSQDRFFGMNFLGNRLDGQTNSEKLKERLTYL